MTILITGGAGFVGSHTVAELHRRGGAVHLLVRDRRRAARALRPHGVDLAELRVTTGDVTDPATVAAAVRDCSAVLHAAAVYSFDPRRRAEIRAVTRRGTEVVLDAARAAGVPRIVHVSTFGTLVPAPGPVTADSPVRRPREPYLAAKAAAERVARRHQDEGAPVTIVHPPALLGPRDPKLGDQSARIRDVLRGLMPIWPDGGFPIGDVRDLAGLHASLLDGGPVPARVAGPGRFVPTRELLAGLRRVTGRRLPAVHLPAVALLPVGRLAGLAQRVLPVHVPVEYGAIYACRVARPLDTAATDDLRGTAARPLVETLADTVRWLHEAGHVSAAQAGRAA
ncbi:NAD-dependent epimerase/dehydratase family protein [Micromonospora sp. PLK6-60]|uniref:NAD-dependent epimerase/dehydratase family protein n=1 Tax=Micromonospora sp. PLK6-60 TaxID=2873383 RepID=UPI001CA5FBA5|nr:NAD-dependent epimerase/dehydratase family protein [Micromonospora sp. PLK6-60]MBY8870764.1 NAD-dependent epimerase/dehydratase family protein [Micromonospora sp. PLK6-60]